VQQQWAYDPLNLGIIEIHFTKNPAVISSLRTKLSSPASLSATFWLRPRRPVLASYTNQDSMVATSVCVAALENML